MMKLRRVWVTNYRYFRTIIEQDDEANRVLENLYNCVDAQINQINEPYINLTIGGAYDDDGVCLFDVVEFKKLKDNSIIVNVEFTSTAK